MWKKPIKARDSSSVEEAYAYALKLLEIKWRGAEELRDRLRQRTFTEAVIHKVVEKLQKLAYLDDTRLIGGLIRDYKEVGLYGPLYIKQKLIQRRFPRAEVEEALRKFYTAREELLIAQRFFVKQKGLDISDPKQKNRSMQRFLRRGFSASVVIILFKNAGIE